MRMSSRRMIERSPLLPNPVRGTGVKQQLLYTAVKEAHAWQLLSSMICKRAMLDILHGRCAGLSAAAGADGECLPSACCNRQCTLSGGWPLDAGQHC